MAYSCKADGRTSRYQNPWPSRCLVSYACCYVPYRAACHAPLAAGVDADRRQATLVRALLATLLTVLLVLPTVRSHAITLSALPYRNPAPLDALVAQSEMRLAATLTSQWPSVETTIASYFPGGATLSGSSAFATQAYTRCLRTHEAISCRLLMDLLSFEMKSRRPRPAATATPLPVLMRPAQLSFKDTALPKALLALEPASLQAALNSHWRWVKDIINRFLPDSVDLHPVSKVFGSLRATCQTTHTDVACRNHLSDIVGFTEANQAQPPTVVQSLAQIPYRDPAPLQGLLALNDAQLRGRLADWSRIDALLNRYIAWPVAIAGDVEFARARLDCQVGAAGDFFMCRRYLERLDALMRSKAGLASPFS